MTRVGSTSPPPLVFFKFLALKLTLLYLDLGLLKLKESCGLLVVGNWVACDIGSEDLRRAYLLKQRMNSHHDTSRSIRRPAKGRVLERLGIEKLHPIPT